MKKNSITLKNNYSANKYSDLGRYYTDISKIKMLTEVEEKSLAVDLYENASKEAAQKLVISYLPLVVKVANSYRGYGLSLPDIIAEGNIGLMKAVAKFDPYKGFRLSTYAIWWIKAYISDYILNSWSIVKSGTLAGRKKLFFSLNRIKNKLNLTGKSLSKSEVKMVAKEAKVSERDVHDVSSMVFNRDVYLQAPLSKSENSSTLEDIIEDNISNPEEIFADKQEKTYFKKIISNALEVLSFREKEIIKKRYMIDKPLSLETIGNNLGISRERVRQIEGSSLKKIKGFLEAKKVSLNI